MPAAQRSTLRIGAGAVKNTTYAQPSVSAAATSTCNGCTCASNPGATRARLAAMRGGVPLTMANQPSQTSTAAQAKVTTPNQSSAEAAPRRSVGMPCEARKQSGASTEIRFTSSAGPQNDRPPSVRITATAGTNTRGSRQRARSAQHAQSASGQAGQANQLAVEKKYSRFASIAPCGCIAIFHHE